MPQDRAELIEFLLSSVRRLRVLANRVPDRESAALRGLADDIEERALALARRGAQGGGGTYHGIGDDAPPTESER